MYSLVMTFVIVAALEATFKHIKYYEYYKKIYGDKEKFITIFYT